LRSSAFESLLVVEEGVGDGDRVALCGGNETAGAETVGVFVFFICSFLEWRPIEYQANPKTIAPTRQAII
jgi:hypothetical protein